MRKHLNITNFLVGFIIFAAVFSSAFFVYQNYQRTQEVKKAQIAACEQNLAKSQIIVEFMLKAAQIRRASAEAEDNPAVAANDIRAAEAYERQAEKYDDLTPKNCLAEVE